MKKALLSLTLIGIIAFITVLSCKKTKSNSGPQQSLNQLFSGLQSTPQSFSVTAGRDTIVYGNNGTMLHFYTNSFKDANNNIITAGTVNLQLIEMYKAADMIGKRATTTANGQILMSGGQITMNATMNGQEVYANVYGLGFKHGSSSSASMALFYGSTGNADSTTTWIQSDTRHAGTKTNGTTHVSTTHHTASIFLFDTCNNFTWANCDWFCQSDSIKTTVSVILPDTSYNASNTEMFLVLPNVTCCFKNSSDTFTAVLSNVESNLGSSSYVAATNTLTLVSEHNTAIVPAGTVYELVVITNKNGNFYYYSQSGIIPHNGLSAIAAMAPDTQQDIKDRLAGL